MKRLARDGHVLQIPRPKDECYLYMPNPAMIHTQSAKIKHFLAIAECYIQLGKPEHYEVEPRFDEKYQPDAYTVIDKPYIIEVQRSHTSNKKMQEKINGFVDTYTRGKHDAKTLIIASKEKWKVRCPEGFKIVFAKLKEEA